MVQFEEHKHPRDERGRFMSLDGLTKGYEDAIESGDYGSQLDFEDAIVEKYPESKIGQKLLSEKYTNTGLGFNKKRMNLPIDEIDEDAHIVKIVKHDDTLIPPMPQNESYRPMSDNNNLSNKKVPPIPPIPPMPPRINSSKPLDNDKNGAQVPPPPPAHPTAGAANPSLPPRVSRLRSSAQDPVPPRVPKADRAQSTRSSLPPRPQR